MASQTLERQPVSAPAVSALPAEQDPTGAAGEQFDLDVSFLEAGGTVKDLIFMTNDSCGTTCESACSPTCG